MKKLILAAFVAALVLPASASASQPGMLIEDGGHTPKSFKVRPDQVSYTGDGTGILGGEGWTDGSGIDTFGRINWTTWNQREAKGTGINWINDCDPSCGGGTYYLAPATIHAFSVKGNKYRRLTIRRNYHGRIEYERRVLGVTGHDDKGRAHWAWYPA
jgi:hypothetical protein